MALQSVGRPGCSLRRTPLLVSWLLCCLLVVTACSSGHPRKTAAPSRLLDSAKGAVTVPVTAAGALATTAAWQVRVAATTSAGTGATLTIAPPGATAPAVAPPAGLRPGSDPARFALMGAQLGTGGAVVTRKLSAPVPVDQQASLAYFDETVRTWVAVPTVVSADRRQLTAHTAHFSIWDDIYYGIGAGITKRADAPSCSGATPSWVRDTTFFDDLNAPLQWCAGRDPKNPQWLVVKVVASRAYGFLMRPAVTPQWTYSSFLHDVPGAADLITAGIDQTLRLPDLLQPMDGGVFLAPGTEVDFGFTEQQVRSLKTSELMSADPSITWMLAGSMYSAVSAVTGKDNAKFAYAYSLVAALQCAHDLVKANSGPERSTAFVTCLASNAKDIYTAAIDLAAKAGMDTKVAATKIPAVAAVSFGVAAASVGAQIGEWFNDQTQPPESRALSVSLQRVMSPQRVLPEAYYGPWRVHGGGLTVNRDGTALGNNHVGNTASFEFIYEVDHYRIAPSSDGTYAVLTTTEVFWGVPLGNGQWRRVPNPDPSVIITVVGDRFSLRLLRPQLLKTTPFPGNHWNGEGGNPYLCGPHITAPDVALCGA
jgi:hypothetical protein